jgi:hypothetical protein
MGHSNVPLKARDNLDRVDGLAVPSNSPALLRSLVNRGGSRVSKALIAAALLGLGVISLVQQDTTAMAVPASGVQPAVAMPAIADTVALRRSRTATRRVAVRHRGVTVRTHGVARAHRRGAVRTRHAAARPRAVAARKAPVAVAARKAAVAAPARKAHAAASPKTHVATARRAPVAVNSTEVVRPVRPWVQQPYYGSRFDGVVLGTVVAANTVPTSPSVDLCWYWSNSARTRGYWDFCQ